MIEIKYDKDRVAYFSIVTSPSRIESSLRLNGIYANSIGITERTPLQLSKVFHDYPVASAISLEPVSQDDWQILVI